MLPADFVTVDQGTGFVHIAPGHGIDDFELGRNNGLDLSPILDSGGCYLDSVPVFSGLAVLQKNGQEGNANAEVLLALEKSISLFLETTTKDFTKTLSLFSSKIQTALNGFSDIDFPFANNLSITFSLHNFWFLGN